ncbi:MAG: hypothetical protein FJ087_17370 [Deltaproteobacteria bacterium]|nr:hypothetical protein [Deltaproteobacteria bacterium]
MISKPLREKIEALVLKLARTRDDVRAMEQELDALWGQTGGEGGATCVPVSERPARKRDAGKILPALQRLADMIGEAGEDGISLADLSAKTGRRSTSLRSDVSRVKKAGLVDSIGTGRYQHTKFKKVLELDGMGPVDRKAEE